MSGKTEQPTARRLRKAREQGDSAVSLPLAQAAGFAAALALLPGAFAAAAARLAERVRWSIEGAGTPLPTGQLVADVLVLSAPVLLAAALTGAVASFVQTGGVIAWSKVSPDLTRANPFTGLQNLFSWQRVASVVRALLTALVVGAVCIDLLFDHAASLVGSTGSIATGTSVALDLAKRLAWIAALIGLGFAAVDLLLTRRAWIKRLMMTRDEVRRELRETEGDPEIKQARRQAHHALLMGATLNAIRDASVLIVNPTHLATALRYSSNEDDAPRIIAQGEGELARRMIDAARAYGVPVVRDVPVARALQELEIGDQIPEALYEAVAEILREVWEEAGSTGG
jgi:flagellar biosynthesis protein FlhB